jgi:hypothetical protein
MIKISELNSIERKISKILFNEDPIGIAFKGENDDEYDIEAKMIYQRLGNNITRNSVIKTTKEVFNEMFNSYVDADGIAFSVSIFRLEDAELIGRKIYNALIENV